jgi:hypothetical protein
MIQNIIATGDFVILLVTAARTIFYFPSGTSGLHERNDSQIGRLSLLCNLKPITYYLPYNPFLNLSLLHYNAMKATLQTSSRSKHTSPGLVSIKTHQLLR